MNKRRYLHKYFLLANAMGLLPLLATGQCTYTIDTVDRFDGTYIVASKPVNIGYTIPSNVLTDEGYKMIEEAKVLFSYAMSDTVGSFFLTIAAAEREFVTTREMGPNMLVLMSNDSIYGFITMPDRGVFNRDTNMRIYNHTGVVTYNQFFALTHFTIQSIRLNYKGYKRTIFLSERQQEDLRELFRCIGEAVNLYPLKN